jgi:nitrite reductase/ring-hydroxylating ferredoxin subunit
MAEFVKVESGNDVAPGAALLVYIDGKDIALFNIAGAFFAIDNACTHEEGPLAEGEIEGHEVACPRHAPPGVPAEWERRSRSRLLDFKHTASTGST